MKIQKFQVILIFVLFSSCQFSDDGYNSLITTNTEEPGTNCEAGGIVINYGLDLNRNNSLEQSEIQNSEYLCNGGGNISLDNLTRLEIGSPNDGTCGTDWYMTPYKTFQLPDFNKLDYSNVASILFVPSMVSFDENNTVTVELFNVTDSVTITNSTLEHSAVEYVFKYSGNIYNDLPSYPITLSIRMKNSAIEKCGGLGVRSYLYILRN
jgi:hypothetical protein